uniref:BHLH domain-containing protein n=1 Tax=Strigamia maritima TaxID=126957 RepID=T1J4E7_STRMM
MVSPAVSPVSDEQLNFTRKRSVRDPLSHRIIEKKRRDRMNNCLANLSSLLPSSYWKKSRGRIEKTEIIEMAITHMKYLQMQIKLNRHSDTATEDKSDNSKDSFCFGYQECMAEIMHFLVEVEGFYPRENLCIKLLNHLRKHGEEISKRYDMSQNPTAESPQQSEVTNHSETLFSKKIEVSSTIILKEETLEETEINDDYVSTTQKQFSPNSTNYVVTERGQHLQENGKTNDHMLVPHLYQCYQPKNSFLPSEEIYKYKTRIKHRFNADLQFCKQKEGIQAN